MTQTTKWLPIETAPKDGAWLMLYWKNMPISDYPAIGFYIDGDYSNPNAWTSVKNVGYGNEEIYPTHWMSMPQPPGIVS